MFFVALALASLLFVWLAITAMLPVRSTSERLLCLTVAPPQRIAILTLETRASQPHTAVHNASCTAYAARHGYEYVFVSEFSHEEEMPVYWQKLQAMQATMLRTDRFDYVLWLDSDTVIAHPKVRLEAVINLAPNATIFIGEDPPGIAENVLCAGVFMLRNDDRGKGFLKDCLDTYRQRKSCRDGVGKLALNGPWAGPCYEQGVMNELLRGAYAADVVTLPSWIVSNDSNANKSLDAFIVHRWGDKTVTAELFKTCVQP